MHQKCSVNDDSNDDRPEPASKKKKKRPRCCLHIHAVPARRRCFFFSAGVTAVSTPSPQQNTDSGVISLNYSDIAELFGNQKSPTYSHVAEPFGYIHNETIKDRWTIRMPLEKKKKCSKSNR